MNFDSRNSFAILYKTSPSFVESHTPDVLFSHIVPRETGSQPSWRRTKIQSFDTAVSHGDAIPNSPSELGKLIEGEGLIKTVLID
jgi:hypothetical protein